MTAPSENISVELNTTVYANVVFNKKKNICTKPAVPLKHYDKSITMRKNNGTKRSQRTFTIEKNV